jgi:ABC-type branched-subunit amino acid transport system substrate-binding protein
MSDLSRVVEAAKRLERAVLRLEAAIEQTGGGTDRAGLQRALADAKAQYASLSQVTQTVASRLDQAIGRLDRVLEG